ncbi:hypothetical protein [Acinetobacter sp.]|uniref:hypothetical protein n=1 Tax=Acinetobacter sp. TaxID=472 RepID=UPI00388E7C50
MTIFQTFKDFIKVGSKADLYTKCEPFLKESGGLPLYRGYGMELSAKLHGQREVTVRKDRKPRDSNKETHEIMNAFFMKKYGVNVRSEGLFSVGDVDAARSYGHPHYVLPVGEFKYIWAELNGKPVRDTLVVAQKIRQAINLQPSAKQQEIAFDVLNQFTWHSDNLKKAITSGAEITLLCDKAIIIPVTDKSYSPAEIESRYSSLIKHD